jgi:hypothetical protein
MQFTLAVGTHQGDSASWLCARYLTSSPAFTLDKAHQKDALAFTRASSHLFSGGQKNFVTVCESGRLLPLFQVAGAAATSFLRWVSRLVAVLAVAAVVAAASLTCR